MWKIGKKLMRVQLAMVMAAVLCLASVPLTALAGSVPVYDLALPTGLVQMSPQLNAYDDCDTTNFATKYTGHFYATLSNVPANLSVSNGMYLGSCVDLLGTILDYQWTVYYDVLLYSSTDPTLGSADRLAVSWNKINYIINIPSGSGGQHPTWLDKQAAMWSLLYPCGVDPVTQIFTCTNPYKLFPPGPDWPAKGCPGQVDQSTVDAIVLNANTYGDQFIPVAGQKKAVIVDPQKCNGTTQAGTDECALFQDMQLIVIEVPVPTCTGSIGDFVWQDSNGNGIQDAGEPGIGGVNVYLEDANGKLLATAVTDDGTGHYQFTNLCGTTYKVEVDATVPAGKGLYPTEALQGGDTARDRDSNPSPSTVTLSSTNNFSDQSIDFGFAPLCSGQIGDYVWSDLNQNGIQDPGEPGINNVKITLTGIDTVGRAYSPATTATDKDGYYQFSKLCAGTYTVTVDSTNNPALSGYTPTSTMAGGLGNEASDSNPIPTTVTYNVDNFQDKTIDFGYVSQCTGSIGDFVWLDLDGDGIQDNGEPGLNGVTLTLTDSKNKATTKVTGLNPDPMAVNQNGYYKFTLLCPDTYTVQVTSVPAGYTPTQTLQGGNTALDSNPNLSTVTLSNFDDSDITVDFGYVPKCKGVIGDFVWLDLDHDGIQDNGEPGIPGVKVQLKDSKGNVIDTTTTDANGYYQFAGRCFGTYTVVVDQCSLPWGYTPTKSQQGADRSKDSNGSPASVTLSATNPSDLTIDFGYYTCCCGSIGNYVWLDSNGNGIQDWGESGVKGVVVNLRDTSGTLLASTTTDCNGYYQFTKRCEGDYVVEIVPPIGYSLTTYNAAKSNTSNDSNPNPSLVHLTGNCMSDQTIDFGLVKVKTPCPGTPCYWKDHPDAWPVTVSSITIGGKTYTKTDAIKNMAKSVCNDGTYTLFRELVATKLNLLIGTTAGCITDTVTQADAWMASHQVGSGVTSCSSAWKTGKTLADKLDQYNNGKLCATCSTSTSSGCGSTSGCNSGCNSGCSSGCSSNSCSWGGWSWGGWSWGGSSGGCSH